ncbi:mitofilin family membrane protein [Phyllobacterium sp. OV277]|uniref:COG4223 family protein n=1 Tax=Phyllobacterium sp. OV277 TaxID=1882772 RepID=UPI000885260C|nr:mitofilin family membrane protein [Phyllobacterium sp. OV277]SDO66622.1 Uncharacterized conserved protein [Phyllobacterium sp. OV277]
MAKASVPRHSKSARKPVTIELEPSDIVKDHPAGGSVPQPEPVGFDPDTSVQAQEPKSEPVEAAAVSSEDKPKIETASQQTSSFGRSSSAEQPKPATPASIPVPPKAGDPLGRLTSGLIGGVVALLGAAALQWAGILPSPKSDLSAVEQQIAELRNAAPAKATLDEGSQVALNGAVENAKQALGQVSGLADELKALKQNVAATTNAAGAGTTVDTSAIDARIATLESQLTASQQKVEQAAGALAGEAQTSAALQTRLDALETKVQDNSGQNNMALAIAATGLKSAIDRGGPFAAELDTYLAVAPASADVEGLRTAASAGVPTVSMLASQFGDVATKIIATTRTVDPNAGILDRLWSSAEGLVESRPVGLIEGEGVDAMTARVEAHLNAGDLNAAIAEWDKLPESAKAVSTDFANTMRARQKAGDVVSKALSNALTGMKTPAAAQ